MTEPIPPQDRVIVALDVPTLEGAIALINRLPDVTFWKVGLELFVSAGPQILTHLKERGKRIFLDLKLHDIPNTMAGACRVAGRYGVDLLTLHATAGSTALRTSVEAATEAATSWGGTPPRLIAVTLLTSIDARTLAMELKVPLELPDYALQMAMLAKASGLSGVVCSPKEAGQIREVCGNEFLRVCPGVRPRGSALGDQRRALPPAAALQAGASYLVIGRPITAAPDPATAFQSICDELQTADA